MDNCNLLSDGEVSRAFSWLTWYYLLMLWLGDSFTRGLLVSGITRSLLVAPKCFI